MHLFANHAVIFICVPTLIVSWQALQHSEYAASIFSSRTPLYPFSEFKDILPRDSASDNGTTYWAVTCVYSVSGVYTRFQRILFYIAMVFTFCFRFHEWLTASGVAFIVTYSTIAAVHGMVLSLQQNIGTDLDHVAITVLLNPGLFGSTVFAFYYGQIFGINSTGLFGLWTISLAIVQLFLLGNWTRFITGLGNSAMMVACDANWNCNDTCPNIVQSVLFRSSLDNMVPRYLGPWAIGNRTTKRAVDSGNLDNTTLSSTTGIRTAYINLQISLFKKSMIISNMCFLILRTTLVNLDYPPKQARNWVVRFFTSKRTTKNCGLSRGRLLAAQAITTMLYIWQALVLLIWPLFFVDIIAYGLILWWDPQGTQRGWIFKSMGIRHEPSKRRLRIATGFALSWYLWACVGYIYWPAIFFRSIFDAELLMNGLPESEAIQAVGQWGSWVSVGLAFMVACVHKRFSNAKDNAPKPIFLNELEERGIENPPRWVCNLPMWNTARNLKSVVFLAEEWTELKSWWNDPLEVSWIPLHDNKESDILEKRMDDGEREEHMLAWCKQDEEAEIGFETVLERITKRGKVSNRAWECYLPDAETARAADSNATDL